MAILTQQSMKAREILQDVIALEKKFNGTCEDFQRKIKRLALKYDKGFLQIYDWWRDYSRDCQGFDQSPILMEFEEWYNAKLEA